MTKFIRFVDCETREMNRKMWSVFCERENRECGHVVWHHGLAEYVFAPGTNWIGNEHCMEDVTRFLGIQNIVKMTLTVLVQCR